MNITIHEDLRSFVEPLTPVEYAALERSLLAEGCRDALVLWNDVLIDGHNRYEICKRHNIEFKTIQNTRFETLEDVMLWMIENHLARRSVSDYQRGLLALKKKDIVTHRAEKIQAEKAAAKPDKEPPPLKGVPKRHELAKEARVSSATIGQIEKIRASAAPELVEAVRQGTISINAAANVAALPWEEQQSAVAGGRKELQQAAKMVREQQNAAKPPREPKEGAEPDEFGDKKKDELVTLRAQVHALKQKLVILTAENAALKEQLSTRSPA